MISAVDYASPVRDDLGQPAPSWPEDLRRLLPRDFALLAAFCLLLFGYQMFSGRPLSLHEARLPETSREMLLTHHWLFPQSGSRPWLERPPLPHWIVIGTSVILGQRCDSVWVVRLPSVLMGLSIVLMIAWMASVWLGRNVGMLSGLVLATMYEFYAYSILAEDDIYLAAIVTLAVSLFVSMEFASGRERDVRVGFFGNRPWQVWAFFFVLGLMNIVKSPLLGAAVVVAPVGAFLLLSFDAQRIRRYVWFWGWLLFGALLVWWAILAVRRYPDVLQNWRFDYQDTSQYDEPIWYYPVVALLGLCMPWILASITGLLVSRGEAWRDRLSWQRFLWLWAIMPLIVLSIHHRKHHHYFVPSIAPWAILSSIGLAVIWRDLTRKTGRGLHPSIPVGVIGVLAAAGLWIFRARLTVPARDVAALAAALLACVGVFFLALRRRRGVLAAAACFVGVGVAYCWGQSVLPDLVADDTAFLHRAEREVPRDQPLFVNADLGGEMDFFRNQFYVRPSAVLLHNLSYLRDEAITAPDVWIITRRADEPRLKQLGTVDVMDESAHTRRERSPEGRFTLFRLHFRPDLLRYPKPPYIDTLQAMDRRPGPYCGPPL